MAPLVRTGLALVLLAVSLGRGASPRECPGLQAASTVTSQGGSLVLSAACDVVLTGDGNGAVSLRAAVSQAEDVSSSLAQLEPRVAALEAGAGSVNDAIEKLSDRASMLNATDDALALRIGDLEEAKELHAAALAMLRSNVTLLAADVASGDATVARLEQRLAEQQRRFDQFQGIGNGDFEAFGPDRADIRSVYSVPGWAFLLHLGGVNSRAVQHRKDEQNRFSGHGAFGSLSYHDSGIWSLMRRYKGNHGGETLSLGAMVLDTMNDRPNPEVTPESCIEQGLEFGGEDEARFRVWSFDSRGTLLDLAPGPRLTEYKLADKCVATINLTDPSSSLNHVSACPLDTGYQSLEEAIWVNMTWEYTLPAGTTAFMVELLADDCTDRCVDPLAVCNGGNAGISFDDYSISVSGNEELVEIPSAQWHLGQGFQYSQVRYSPSTTGPIKLLLGWIGNADETHGGTIEMSIHATHRGMMTRWYQSYNIAIQNGDHREGKILSKSTATTYNLNALYVREPHTNADKLILDQNNGADGEDLTRSAGWLVMEWEQREGLDWVIEITYTYTWRANFFPFV